MTRSTVTAAVQNGQHPLNQSQCKTSLIIMHDQQDAGTYKVTIDIFRHVFFS